MPIIKSAKKRMKQNLKRRERNYPVRSELKTLIKKELKYISDGKVDEAVKFMPIVFSIIDKACKKQILPQNTAARRKSRIARALNELQKKGTAKPASAEAKVSTVAKAEKAEEAKA